MNTTQKLRHAIVGGTLLLAALSSAALTLGRTRGAALIGRPLDLSIQVRFEASEEASVQCFEADVFHADTRVDGSRVSLQLEPGVPGQDSVLRVRSSATVDEPVVTVYIRAGCQQRVTRRYVLLADFPSESVAPAPSAAVVTPPAQAVVAARPGPAGAVPVAPLPQAAAAVASPASSPAAPARPRSTPRPASAAPAVSVQAEAPAARAPSVVRRKSEAPARPRLKLEPLDLLVERDPTLKTSPELLTAPAEDAQQRALAAALWRALNAQPQDVLRDAQRMQALEADLKSLRELTVRNQASIGELRGQLQQAERERYANGLVYALAALLLLAVGTAVFLWRRSAGGRSGSSDWWRRGDTAGGALDEDATPDSLMTPLGGRAPATGKGASVDVDLDVDESMFASLKTARLATVPPPTPSPAPTAVRKVPAPVVDHVDFQPSMTGGGRAVNVEELFDIQQQADFFLSLGQHDQAIEVLKTHIHENSETSALAYLDLLKIYHQLDRRDDYSGLRDDFNRVFNAQVPVFEAFTEASSGLEAYQKALSRIEALWPSPKVLEIIEESIFRKPDAGGEAFDLEAYRELLLLYAMAKDVVERGGSMMDFDIDNTSVPPEADSQPPSGFSNTNIQPLSASLEARQSGPMAYDDEQPEATPLPEIAMPRPSPRLGLDIDLSELAPEPPSSDFQVIGDEPPAQERPPHPARDASAPDDSRAHDGNLMDFDLFDASTEREIAPRRPPKR